MDEFTQTPLYSIPPVSKPVSRMSRKVLFWSTITAVVLGIISVLLFFYGGSSFSESGVVLTITGPTQASVGDEVVYKVHYQNTTKSPLRNIKLSFFYPDSSVIVVDGKIANYA